MKSSTKNIIAATAEATNAFSREVEALRQKIMEKKSKLLEIEMLPIDQSEAVRRLSAFVRQQASKGIAPSARSFTLPASEWHFPAGNLEGLILELMASQVEAALTADLEEIYRDRPGVSEVEREELRRQADREILDLELVEESIIREARKLGIPIDWRGDVDPRAFLADESALP